MVPPTAIARIPISENETIRRKEEKLESDRNELFYYVVNFNVVAIITTSTGIFF